MYNMEQNHKKICLLGGEDAHKRIPLALILIQHGWSVTIMGTAEHAYPPEIPFINYSLNRKLNLFDDIKTMRELRKLIENGNYRVVQTFDTKPAFLLPLALLRTKIPIVRTVTGLGTLFMHNTLKYRLLRFVYKFLHRMVGKRVSHTTFQNDEDWGYFLKNNLVTTGNSSLILGSGIEIDENRSAAPRANKKPVFICVARLVYEKGIINYLEAAKMCRDKGFNYSFLLIGPLEEESKRLNATIMDQYAKFVDWLGPRKDVPELMRKSDFFVLPTFREGLSRVILEACSFGLPVITTDVPGTRDIVRDGIEGLLVPVNQSEKLSEAMILLGENRNMANRMALKAFERAEAFSLRTVSQDYLNLYNSLV